ncbi:MAG: GspE/PulE family protein [Helicobacteraceae bacterium]|jgi:general secretion pathway protein E|nr:GspE/PulE family protein [Helicobacteraceae bacterium]
MSIAANVEFQRLSRHDLEPSSFEGIDSALALKYYALFAKVGGEVAICLGEPYLAESLGFLSKYAPEAPIYLLDQESFDRLYNRFLEQRTDKELSAIGGADNRINEVAEEEEGFSLAEFLRNKADLLNSEEAAPIIRFVNALFYQAIKKGASDIHIEAHERKGEVRFRIDGALVKYVDLDLRIINLVISRIKVISNLDISEKRLAQDGRTQVNIAKRALDIRVSVLPTYYGERVVMRILMESAEIPHLQQLGFEPSLIARLAALLEHSHGIILVTGPTGSGKSTTLHSFLQQIATPQKNVITVEDPVEYKADNINQVQANAKVGLTFAAGLRSILRQDPDVVMIGEIRDGETASIAIQAALTGHLVFSTLHTNTSTGAITRLVDMGVERFLVSSSLLGVLAQRLARKLCEKCKIEDELAESYETEFGIKRGTKIYKAGGCPECNHTGYKGRRAIGELFIPDDEAIALFKETIEEHAIRDLAIKKGMRTLQHQLISLVAEGVTSMDEAIRIGIKSK